MRVRCGVYGEGSVFSVEIEGTAEVEALQEAIFDKQRYHERFSFPASALTLYLAKKDGAWLKSDATLKLFLKQGRQEDSEYIVEMIPNWKLNETEYFGDFQLGEKEIHILVELPKREYADSQLLELQESLLHHVLLDAPTSTSARSNHFKANLCATYDCNMGSGKLRCMLLDTALPSELVIAFHLFRRKNEFLSEKLMGISNIDDVRNGLLLFKPLEHAFDHFQISFIYDQSSNEFRLKIFDQSVRPQRLFGKLDNTQRAILLQGQALPKNWRSRGPRLAPGTVYDIQTTFGDLEGRALRFKSVKRPYKRCLNLQARLARKQAIEKQWIRPDEDDFQDFWSEGMSLAEKMKFYYANED
ncbi:putative HNH nuclease [Plasmopara halstedii]